MGVAAGIAAAAVVGAVATTAASNRARGAQKSAANTAAAETKRSTSEARGDLFKLFPAAQQTARQGFQGGLDVFGQSLPAQTDVFTQGNLGAQQAIAQGLQQQQNALFGNQVDFSQLQPFQVQQPDLGFFQQQLPDVIDPFAQPQGPQNFNPFQGFTGLQQNQGQLNPLAGLTTGPMAGGTFGR